MYVSTRVLLAAAALATLAGLARAQGTALSDEVASPPNGTVATAPGAPTTPSSDATLSTPVTPGPSLAAATAGVRAHTATEDLTAQQLAQRAAHHGGLGTGGALMIVGAAAFIAGLIIGGGAGTAIAVAGAAMGLYGLYLYLQ